ncbi:Hypothetical predicted protein [Mytilus galloprovincialis]|uniref:Chloride channel CLIC-like protein 1 n=1 Tax=Mytilus galloprovincialis TaxID=29158 RepID=A0A8B6CA54_MYTGA|nr:Hypothetical predicted protein [Mytilus galloprovincialis]
MAVLGRPSQRKIMLSTNKYPTKAWYMSPNFFTEKKERVPTNTTINTWLSLDRHHENPSLKTAIAFISVILMEYHHENTLSIFINVVQVEHNKEKKYNCMFILQISIPWEYVRLFQIEVAKRMAVMGKGVPSECYPERMTITESVRYWMLLQLSWQHDPCEKYHTALLVDPLWEITPLMVLSSVITRSLLHPIELFFGGIGKSFRLFFNEIPAQWQPIMLIVIVVVFLLTIVILCGYRISLPLILKIEPKTPQSCKTKSHTGSDSIDGYTKTNNFDIKDRKQIEYSQEKS